jgi:predicted transcriptional regulator of viral defense system
MRYLEFREEIKELPIFNLNDIRKIDPAFHKPQLSYWQEKGWVKSIAGGYYAFGDTVIDNIILNVLANKIVQPSYISLESALSYYQIIPERVFGVTSVTSKKTSHFESRWGIISYRSLKPDLMFGYEVVRPTPGRIFLIASLEKTILDYLYLNSHISGIDDFDGLRWDREALSALIENQKFQSYLMRFNKHALGFRVEQMMRYLNA